MTGDPRKSLRRRPGYWVALVAAMVALGVFALGHYRTLRPRAVGSATDRAPTSEGYDSAEYEEAIRRAIAWVDGLSVDPVALQARGVKGKKKLAEALAVYEVALRYESDPEERRRLRRRFSELAASTSRPEYHNMLTCDVREFKQNAMSYLRVLWLMERAGLDTATYERELVRAKKRFDEHMLVRGAWQRGMFRRYYEAFGLEKPLVLSTDDGSLGVIAARLPLGQYDRLRAYQLTHEVFVAFDYGVAEAQQTLTKQDLSYLVEVLPPLIDRSIQLGDVDLLSELVTSMVLVGFRGHPAVMRGVSYLLGHQNPDGTWGDYEPQRAEMGDLVDQHLYLHTTLAAAQAMLETRGRARVLDEEPMRH